MRRPWGCSSGLRVGWTPPRLASPPPRRLPPTSIARLQERAGPSPHRDSQAASPSSLSPIPAWRAQIPHALPFLFFFLEFLLFCTCGQQLQNLLLCYLFPCITERCLDLCMTFLCSPSHEWFWIVVMAVALWNVLCLCPPDPNSQDSRRWLLALGSGAAFWRFLDSLHNNKSIF